MTQATGGTGFPLPGTGRATVAVPRAGTRGGAVGRAPSAAVDPTAGSSSPTGSGWSTVGGRPPWSPAPPTARP
jgi:hypothetical protein